MTIWIWMPGRPAEALLQINATLPPTPLYHTCQPYHTTIPLRPPPGTDPLNGGCDASTWQTAHHSGTRARVNGPCDRHGTARTAPVLSEPQQLDSPCATRNTGVGAAGDRRIGSSKTNLKMMGGRAPGRAPPIAGWARGARPDFFGILPPKGQKKPKMGARSAPREENQARPPISGVAQPMSGQGARPPIPSCCWA
eukprot:gene13966-biopygen5071